MEIDFRGGLEIDHLWGPCPSKGIIDELFRRMGTQLVGDHIDFHGGLEIDHRMGIQLVGGSYRPPRWTRD